MESTGRRPLDGGPAAALHVTNGDSAAGILRRTGLAANVLPWRDALHDGPVPAVSDRELRRVRAEFLAGEDLADRVELLRWLEHRDRTLAGRAWAALRAAHPGGLGAVAATPSPELRFLGEAFDRLSREYPSTRDGLSLTERRILAATADGATTVGEVHARIGAREARPYLADLFCFRIVARLVRARTPLLAAEPSTGAVGAGTRVRLTAAGLRVLQGDADHVAQGGVDRWIGGVHLAGPDSPWRWDEGTESIAASPGG